MIIRKPTKIELKPEDDFYEYEEYKRKQMEQQKFLNPISQQLLKQDKEFYFSPEESKQLVLEQTNALKNQFQQQSHAQISSLGYQSPSIDSFFSIGGSQRQQGTSSSAFKDISAGNQQQFLSMINEQPLSGRQQPGQPDQTQLNQFFNILLSSFQQQSSGPQQQQQQQGNQ